MARASIKNLIIKMRADGASETKRKLSGVEKSIIAMGGALVTYAAAQKALEFVKLGAQLSDLTKANENLAKAQGLTSKSMINEMQKATKGTVSQLELYKQANTALLLGLPITEKTMGELANAGRRLGKAMGIDAAMGLESLTVGIGRQSKLWLDNLGILIDTDRAYSDYAATLGKTKDSLTDVEKKQGFFNATMESVRAKMAQLGKDQLTITDRFKAMGIAAKDAAISIAKSFNEIGVSSVEKDIKTLELFISRQETERTDRLAIQRDLQKEQFKVVKGQGEIYQNIFKSFIGIFTKTDELKELGVTDLETAKKKLAALKAQQEVIQKTNLSVGQSREVQIELAEKAVEMKTQFSEIGFFAEQFPPNLKLATVNTQLAAKAAKEWRNNQRSVSNELGNSLNSVNQIFLAVTRLNRLLKKDIRKWNFGEFLGAGLSIFSGAGAIKTGLKAFGFNEGGVVPSVRPNSNKDTVPALLTPGEVILNAAQQKNLVNKLNGVTINISGDFVGTEAMADKLAQIIEDRSGLGFNRLAVT